MLARAQFTVRDENDITVSATAPASPVQDELWLDTSVTPNLLKRWGGAAWIECSAEPVGNELVVGTQTVGTAAWTGIASFAELRDGQDITYWLPLASGNNATLTLTLADGSVTATIPCYYGGLTRLGTQYTAGSILHLTYRENAKIYNSTIPMGWWADANYNVDTYDRIRFSSVIKAKTAISASRLIVGDAVGYYHAAAEVPFDVTKPILWTTYAFGANAFGSNNYLAYPFCQLSSTLTGFSGVSGKTCYLVGTLSGSTFTPSTQFLTSSVPDAEDGYTYIALGLLVSLTQMNLYPEHPMYRWVNGEFKSLAQVAYEAHAEAEALQTELSTAIEQTDAAIALKADKTVTDSLGNRLETAEASITTQAGQISSVVSQSQTTTNNLNALTIGGRNYVLNSDRTVELNNTGDTFSTTWISPAPTMSPDFLQDCKGKNIVISYYAMCENLERSASGSWIGFQIAYKTETSAYVYNIMTVTNTLSSGTKAWSRYRITTTLPTTAVSVQSVLFGIQNCKGLVRLRNVQVECGNRITDYSPAPEDLALRMDSAESSITQHANQIALKVNTSTYNVEKVYRSLTAPSGTLYGSMLWLDLSLTPNILKRWTGSAWVAVGAQELKTSGITIGSNNVAITTEQFLLQLLDPENNENVLMEMSATGHVGFKELYADNVRSDSVVNAYTGPATLYVNPSFSGNSTSTFRSLRDALAMVNGKYLRYNVTVMFATTTVESIYEPSCIEIYGVTGPYRLQINGQYRNKTIAGYFTVKSCTAQVQFYYLNIREGRGLINGTSKNSYLIECNYSSYVSFRNCVMDCNNTTSRGIQGVGSYLDIRNSEFYNVYIAVGMECCTGMMNACKGVADWSIYAVASLAMLSGTVPTGSRSAAMNGQIFAAGVTTDGGTAIIPVSPSETTIQYATLTASWKGSWRTDTLDVVQGLYSDYGYNSSLYWNRGCMWFGGLQNVLEYGAVEIESATLTLHRKTGSGSYNPRSVYLCAITNTTNSGTPSIAANYGIIGSIGRGETLSVNVPISLVQGLANGMYGGICLYEPSYNFGSANWSDSYIRISGTDDSYNKPCLLVQYSGSTAHG